MKRVHVVAAAIFSGDRLLIARRSPTKAQGGYWEFPGGKVEGEESEIVALVREINEELGINDLKVLEHVTTDSHRYNEIFVVLSVFACATAQRPTRMISHDMVEWVGRERLEQLNWAPADVVAVQRLRESWDRYLALLS